METRWSKQKLKETTHYSQTALQVRWFKETFGIDVPRDHVGVIMNDGTYQILLNLKCGLTTAAGEAPKKKPNLRL